MVNVFRVDTWALYAQVTTTTGGAFSVQVSGNVLNLIAVSEFDATHTGCSQVGTAV